MKELQRKKTGDALDFFDTFKNRMSTVFEDLLGNMETTSFFKSDFVPKIDIEEGEAIFIVKAEIPGAKKEDVEVTIKNNVITIKGEKKEEKSETKDKKTHIKESVYGSFERTFTLPDYVTGDKAKANFKDGVLIIEIPKEKEKINKQKIIIE